MERKVNKNWVVEMEKKAADCVSSTPAGSGMKVQQSIYRVPEWLKNTNNMKAYRPQVMALGPFHHGDPSLLPMEEHKKWAVARRLTQSGKPLRAYVDAIYEVVDQLLAAYGEDLGKEWRGKDKPRFVEVMITDGFFLLELISLSLRSPNYVPDSQSQSHDDGLFFSTHNFMYMRGAIISDVLVMENQLPLLVLQTLLGVQHTTPNTDAPINGDVHVEDQTDGKINFRMLRFLGRRRRPEWHLPLGLHPLQLYHSSLTYGGPEERKEEAPMEEIMPSAVEIHEAGISFEKSKTDSLLDVHFERGVLSMPALTVDDGFEGAFLNLMAFEHRHAGAGNDVTAYVFFMDNIIDTAQDVSLLKAKRIFKNYLGSDEALAGLINDTLSKGAVMSRSSVINKVQHEVQQRCKKPWNEWRANFTHTYLRNPWVFISLVAASILLLATVLQTIYTIMAFYQTSSTSRSPSIND